MDKKNQHNTHKYDPIPPVLADKYMVTTRFIQQIRDGVRNNELIFSDYMFLKEGWDKLVQEVKRVCPFD